VDRSEIAALLISGRILMLGEVRYADEAVVPEPQFEAELLTTDQRQRYKKHGQIMIGICLNSAPKRWAACHKVAQFGGYDIVAILVTPLHGNTDVYAPTS
jgi:hypothetical protein